MHFFVLQERLDFAMKEIIFDLLSVGKKSNFLTPEVTWFIYMYINFVQVLLVNVYFFDDSHQFSVVLTQLSKLVCV